MRSRATDLDVVALTRALVKIPSQNPGDGEAACAEFLADYLTKRGWECRLRLAEEGRPNLIARASGSGGRALAFLLHLDTVPRSAFWERDPFGGKIENGRLFGLGASDMKGGVAAAVVAATRLLRSNQGLSGDLLLFGTCDEEGPLMKGVASLVEAGFLPADASLVATEPTDCALVVAHKGAMQYEITFRGRAAHASLPDAGADANHALALTITRLYDAVSRRHDRSALLGRSTIVAGKLSGGRKTNVVADGAVGHVDLRILPTWRISDVESCISGIAEEAARQTGVAYSVNRLSLERPPVEASSDGAIAGAIDRSFQAVVGRPIDRIGYTAYTDVAMAAALTGNRDWAVFGPGSLKQAHTADEFVPTDSLHRSVDVLAGAAREVLSTVRERA